MELDRGFADDVLVSAGPAQRVHPGERATIKLKVRHRGGGGERTLRLRVPIPGSLRPGTRTLVLKGNGFDSDEGDLTDTLLEALFGGDESGGGGNAKPRSVRQLAAAVAAVHRPLGIVARFRHREPRVVLKSAGVRYDGQVRVSLRVAR
jgi:hypothetical protein